MPDFNDQPVPGQPQASPPQSSPPPAPPPAPLTGPPYGQQDQSYNFITDSPEPPKRSLLQTLTGGGSWRGRIILAGAGMLAFLVLILVLRAIVGGGGNAAVLISVVQDQQEIIHLAENASNEQSLSSKNRNFAATAQLAVASSQSQLIGYLTAGGKKIDEKQLNLKVSPTTDEQLVASASTGTYNQTFEEVMRSKIDEYGRDLQKAYEENKGPKGRAILTDSYKQAELMATQLLSGD